MITKGHESETALVLNTANDTIQPPVNGGKVIEFSFYYKVVNLSYGSPFWIQGLQNGEWVNIKDFYATADLGNEWRQIDMRAYMESDPYMPINFAGIYDAVRIVTDPYLYEECAFAIDDISIETSAQRQRELIMKDGEYTDNFAILNGLNSEAEYYFSVKSVNDENIISGESELYHAFGVAKPIAKEATDIDPRGGYTANWEPTPKATSYLVTNYKADKIEDDNENYEVFRDDFENIESEPRQMLR